MEDEKCYNLMRWLIYFSLFPGEIVNLISYKLTRITLLLSKSEKLGHSNHPVIFTIHIYSPKNAGRMANSVDHDQRSSMIWFFTCPAYPILTVMFLSFQTDRSGQTVQTQIRLLLESDQGLHCLQFRLHLLDALL